MLKIIAYKFTPNCESGESGTLHYLLNILRRSNIEFQVITRDNSLENTKELDYSLINIDLKIRLYKKIPFIGLYIYYYFWYRKIFAHIYGMNEKDMVWIFNFHSPRMLIPKPNFSRVIFGPLGENKHELMFFDSSRSAYIRFAYLLRNLILELPRKRYLHLIKTCKKAFVLSDSDSIFESLSDISNITLIRQRQQPGIIKLKNSCQDKEITSNRGRGALNIIYIGRPDPIKRPDVCEDVLKKLGNTLIKHKVTIVGEPSISIRNDGQDNYYEYVRHPELLHMLSSYDVLLFPSLESGGLVVDEALSRNCIPLFCAHRLQNKKWASELIQHDLACKSIEKSDYVEWSLKKLQRFSVDSSYKQNFLREITIVTKKYCGLEGYQSLIQLIGDHV
jgi:glycosyltransferase involved in cell wall biosynthesis